ncbi:hypothetical protein BHM03_00017763 [Ensete ventricosum]|nr:hypothetical protein BHM03_00017763 [Ensete ventricosum]
MSAVFNEHPLLLPPLPPHILRCPRLKSLALPDHLMLEDDLRIPDLVGSWRDLEQLEMETKSSSFLRVVAEIGGNCARFSRLKVRGLIGKEDAKAIVDRLPQLKHLELSKSYLTKDELVVIISGCRKLETLIVRDCLGFQADDEVLRLASRITRFEHEGSKLLDEYGYETDEEKEQFRDGEVVGESVPRDLSLVGLHLPCRSCPRSVIGSLAWRRLASDDELWSELFKTRWGSDFAASYAPTRGSKSWKDVYAVRLASEDDASWYRQFKKRWGSSNAVFYAPRGSKNWKDVYEAHDRCDLIGL